MAEFIKGLPDYFEDEDHCELADKAWDQIEFLLDELVQATACSNESVRYLLGAIAKHWRDPADQLAFEVRRTQIKEQD